MSHPEEWVSAPVAPEVREQARELRVKLDALYGLNSQVPDRHPRELGEMGELCLQRWFINQGISHIYVEDDHLHNADFLMGTQKVDVKVKNRIPCQPSYTFGVHAFHLEKPIDWYVFAGWHEITNILTFYGAAHRDDILSSSQIVLPGEVAHTASLGPYHLKTKQATYEYPIWRMIGLKEWAHAIT